MDSNSHTHVTALFPGLPRWAGTRKVSKTNLDFTEADRQPHKHLITLFFTGRMPFLLPNQQYQNTEFLK